MSGSIEAVIPDWSGQDSRLESVVAVAITFLVLSWISVALRIYVRGFLLRAFQWDDITIIITLLLFTASCTTCIGLKQIQTSPQAIAALKQGVFVQFEFLQGIIKWVFAAFGAYLAVVVALKISVALSFLRIVHERWQRYTIYITTAIYTVFGVFFFFLTIFQCGDPTKILLHQVAGKCIDTHTVIQLNYVGAAFNITSDWIFVAIPVCMVWRSKMPKATKLTAAFLLSLGALSSISSIVRIKYIPGLQPGVNFLHDSVSITLWSCVEVGLGIVAISLSTLRPLFKSVLGGPSNGSMPATYEERTNRRNHQSNTLCTNSNDRDVEGLYRISDDDFGGGGTTTTVVGATTKSYEMQDLKEPVFHTEESSLEDLSGKEESALHRSESQQSLVVPLNPVETLGGIKTTTQVTIKHENQR